MKWRTIKIIALVALANIFVFGSCTALIFNCPLPFGDGAIGVHGNVYEWVDPPPGSSSNIYIVNINDIEESNYELDKIFNSISQDISLIPLKEATIVLGRVKDIDRYGDEGYLFEVTTDSDGKFEEGWIIAPTREEFIAKAYKQGYLEVTGKFENSGKTFGHGILAILVKNKNYDN